MGKSYKWGILGPGNIAGRWVDGLRLLPEAVLYSVGSREQARADDFAKLHGFEKAFGSYRELAEDRETDIVYVASPHSHHMEHVLLCLEGGKSVICEKAFAINGREVRAMIDFAARKKLFLMEALWPPFQPSYRCSKELLAGGLAGEILSIRSYFAFKPPYDPAKRLFNKALGGGALLDIGIYPVIDALWFLGKPDKIDVAASFAKTGADSSIDVLFSYRTGKTASLYASFDTGIGIGTDLICEKGLISLRRNGDGSQVCRLEIYGGETEEKIFKPAARGYHFEALEVMKCLYKGKIESEVVPLSFSLDLIDTLDDIRQEAGIVYPGHD